jgi:hypothetical protein
MIDLGSRECLDDSSGFFMSTRLFSTDFIPFAIVRKRPAIDFGTTVPHKTFHFPFLKLQIRNDNLFDPIIQHTIFN